MLVVGVLRLLLLGMGMGRVVVRVGDIPFLYKHPMEE